MIRGLAPCIVTTGLALSGAAAHADSPNAPPVHEGPRVSVQAYGQQNHDCLSWTNGCVLCSAGDDGHSQCSTPGIACQPHGLTCKVLRHAQH